VANFRTLALEEKVALRSKARELEKRVFDAEDAGISKSQIKKLKAQNHNEWQKYLKDNKITQIFGYAYTELETAIEGSIK
jgi:hypothetical protein